jgi:hypothetical protein
MKDKKACKKILKRAKKHPDWYTPEELLYVRIYKKELKQHERKTDQCNS